MPLAAVVVRSARLDRREPRRVEVEAEDGRERDEAGERERRASVAPAEGGEQRGVDEEVDLGVEIAAERARAAGEARELPVGVVEQRLQLDEERRDEQRAAAELDGSRASRQRRPPRRRRAAARAGARARARADARAAGRRPRRGSRSRAAACASGRERSDAQRCPRRSGSARARRRPCPRRSRAARRAAGRPRRT